MSIERFTRSERRYHWANALAILFLGLTGSLIWQDLDHWRPGGVNVLVQSHVWLGGGLLVLSALVFRFFRRGSVPNAARRFNLGQRVNLRAFQALLTWMVLTGFVLNYAKAWGLSRPVRHQIAEVHLFSAATVGLLVLGHLAMVFLVPKNRGIVQAMLTGRVDRAVLERSTPEWLAGLPRGESGT